MLWNAGRGGVSCGYFGYRIWESVKKVRVDSFGVKVG